MGSAFSLVLLTPRVELTIQLWESVDDNTSPSINTNTNNYVTLTCTKSNIMNGFLENITRHQWENNTKTTYFTSSNSTILKRGYPMVLKGILNSVEKKSRLKNYIYFRKMFSIQSSLPWVTTLWKRKSWSLKTGDKLEHVVFSASSIFKSNLHLILSSERDQFLLKGRLGKSGSVVCRKSSRCNAKFVLVMSQIVINTWRWHISFNSLL